MTEIEQLRGARTRVELVRCLPKSSVGAELGVHRAQFSRILLREVRPRILYLVDAWRRWAGNPKEWAKGRDEKNRRDALERIRKSRKTTIVRVLHETTARASKRLKDGILDWVYIDADHSYAGCRRDLTLWTPKVRAGGIVMAHDYTETAFEGVWRAVNEYRDDGRPFDAWGKTLGGLPTFWGRKANNE